MDKDTVALLEGWHAGDSDCLNRLLERHLPLIRAQVKRRLGPVMRVKAETADFVQDAVVEVLTYGPRFRVEDDDHFRALLVRIVENALRDKHDWFTAQRRDLHRERPLPASTAVELGPRGSTGTETPSRILQREEREALIRLGIELLAPSDREVIVLHEWKRLPFSEIGSLLDISTAAARKRFARAVARLGKRVKALRRNDVPAAIQPEEEAIVEW